MDLIFANDPDADRLAVAERTADGGWHLFNGNDTGVLLGHWQWQQHAIAQEGKPAEERVAPGDVYVSTPC